MRSHSITSDARGDILDALRWYEAQRAGLSDEFYAAFEARLTAIREAPDGYEPLGDGYRRARLRRFPYAVVFEASRDRVVVYAVPHLHRSEKAWRRRLKPR